MFFFYYSVYLILTIIFVLIFVLAFQEDDIEIVTSFVWVVFRKGDPLNKDSFSINRK